jgi:septal ring factor EnvC (AmiA/AmiB activator)
MSMANLSFSRALLAAGFGAFACAAVLGAQQADRARTEALAARAADRLKTLQREADQLASQERTLLTDLRRLEVERQIKAEELHRVDAEVAKVTADLNEASARASSLEAREQTERPALRARLVELYKLGQGRYLRLLLSTSDIRRIGQASRSVAALAALDRDRFADYARTLKDLDASRASLEARRHDLTTLRAQVARAATAAAQAAAARDALIRDIDARRDLNAQLSGELHAAQQKLQATLTGLAAGQAVEPAALPLRPLRGDLAWPADGPVRRRFAQEPAAGFGPPSNGIDIAAAEGSGVRAVHDGTVAFAGPFAGFGNLVIVDHGAQAFTLYGNLLEVAVAKGARVERGTPVGTVGESPSGSAGLYFELRVDGRPVDPLQWLRKK